MNLLLETLGDPIWQAIAIALVSTGKQSRRRHHANDCTAGLANAHLSPITKSDIDRDTPACPFHYGCIDNDLAMLSPTGITRRPGCNTHVRFSARIRKHRPLRRGRSIPAARMPDQSGDPAAWTILTLTLAPGSTDRFGRSGDIDYRFTMSDQDNGWTISGICTILSEGCFAIDWG